MRNEKSIHDCQCCNFRRMAGQMSDVKKMMNTVGTGTMSVFAHS